MSKKIAILIGSLRKEAYSRKIAKQLIKLAPAALALEIVEIGDLPFYNEDLETANPPAAWKTFRDTIKTFAGVIFVTPEYNRSVPAVLKNAIDVGSRPYGSGVLNGKPAAVISSSPGAIGGFGASNHLRASLVCLNMPSVLTPEAYLSNVASLFDAEGNLTNPGTGEFLRGWLGAYEKLCYAGG